jgi:uncharacterized protein
VKLSRFDDAKEYYEQVKSYLLLHEAHHNLLLGIVDSLIRNPGRFTNRPYLATVEAEDTLLAVAVRTPPYKLVVSRAVDLQALSAIAQDLSSTPLPGVIGSAPEAEAFAQAWQKVTGQPYSKEMSLRIYQLETVQPIPQASGYLRQASHADRDMLIHWSKAFIEEAVPEDVGKDVERIVDRHLSEGTLYLWQDNQPMSMAARIGPTPNGIRLNNVYTPPEYRRKGYASSCVAQLSQLLLNEGRKYCFLFTDLTNPTSNHIYQTIGYQPVCDVNAYIFIEKETNCQEITD